MNVTDIDVAIIVVDDAKLPCVTIHKALTAVGYHDIRTCHTAADALAMAKQRPADIVLADWCMPDMDGLELTSHIRTTDEEFGRYTSVIVITAMDREDAVAEALAAGADDFIHKSPNHAELIARVANAARISRLQNTVLQTMRVFAKQNRELIDQSAFDPDCGAYIKSFFEKRMQAHIDNASSRGGAVLCMMIRMENAEKLYAEKGAAQYEEIVTGFYQRLQQLVRPIDEVARIDKESFCVKVLYSNAKEYHSSSYNRVLQQLNAREIKTSKGFAGVQCVMSHAVFVGDNGDSKPSASVLIEMSENLLTEAAAAKAIVTKQWDDAD